MSKSIYSLVLSDGVVEAVDALARLSNLSRSAMIDRLLAERVGYTTPEMRLRDILQSLERSMSEAFMLAEKPTSGMLSARTSLKYRYKPTVRYFVDIFSGGGRHAGELRVTFRTQNAQLIGDLTGFFRCWAALEQRYISDKVSGEIAYTISDGRFTRTLNSPKQSISYEELGAAVAEYMSAFDGAMKEYFARLPDIGEAQLAAESYYQNRISGQNIII